MKRLIWLSLAIALAAGPASAAKLMVAYRNTETPSQDLRHEANAALRQFGVHATWYPMTALKTEWLIEAHYRGPEGVTQYDGLLIWCHRKNTYVGGSGGAHVDSLWRTPAGAPRWPKKPTFILSDPVINSTNMLGPPSIGDSVGFGGNPAPSTLAWPSRVRFSPITNRGWTAGQIVAPASRIPSQGVIRDILLDMNGPWTSYAKLAPSGLIRGWATPDLDSVLTTGQDSAHFVIRYRADGNGNGMEPGVIVGISPGGAEVFLPSFMVGIALLDSLMGNQLLFQTAPGPVTYSAQIQSIGSSGRYSASDGQGLLMDVGTFAERDSDLVNVRSNIELMESRGIRLTGGIEMNPDTTGPGGPYRNQLEWWRDLYSRAKVFPYTRSGLSGFKGGNNTVLLNYDPWGADRLRSLLPPGETDPRDGFDCSSDTLSVLCNLKRLRDALVAEFGKDRLDAVWAAPKEDWTPLYFGRNAGNIDSLVWVLHEFLGVRGLRIGNMSVQNTALGGARGWMRMTTVWPVRDPATGTVLGEFAFIASRDPESEQAWVLQNPGHAVTAEFLAGVITGDWFRGSRAPIYVNGHEFFTGTYIMEMPAQYLGGSGDPRYNWRAAVHLLGDLHDWATLLNKLAGRTVVHMGYGEDTAEWLKRSWPR